MKTNVLWGATVQDTVLLRPWGEQITDTSGELVTVEEQKEDERYNGRPWKTDHVSHIRVDVCYVFQYILG